MRVIVRGLRSHVLLGSLSFNLEACNLTAKLDQAAPQPKHAGVGPVLGARLPISAHFHRHLIVDRTDKRRSDLGLLPPRQPEECAQLALTGRLGCP